MSNYSIHSKRSSMLFTIRTSMLLFVACLFSQFIFAQPPPAPVISGITDITSTQAIVHWHPAAGAGSYIVRRYPLGTTDYTYYIPAITDTFRKVIGMLPSTYYSVQVIAIYPLSGDSSDGSLPVSFLTKNGCAAPTELKTKKITDTSAKFRWVLPVTSISNLDIRYRELGTSSWTVENKKATSDLINVRDLHRNTNYEWQIRSNCGEDESVWVKGPIFTTTAGSLFSTNTSIDADMIVNKKATEITSIKTMPNPNHGNFVVRLELPARELLTTLALYNNFGETIWQRSLGKISGRLSKDLSLEDKLSAGVYFLILERSDIRLVEKIVISK